GKSLIKEMQNIGYKNKNLFAQKVKNLKHLFGNTGFTTKTKNVILFLGDRMGLSTVTAARLYKGNVKKTDPEPGCLSFEHFPSVNILDVTVADSAATATSYLGGVKTNQNNIGVSGNVKFKDC
ncbi:membrane-bound alkaline phosphatase-like protein, partial [Leptotrombidium deliense]